MSIPKRSTTGIMQSLYNQPLYQQALLNNRNVGQDKRAVGASNEMLGKAVRGERTRLEGLDQTGYELADRKSKLGFAKQIRAKKYAMALDKMKTQKKSDKLAYILGGASTVASGFGAYTGWRDRDVASNRHDDIMRMLYGYKNTPTNQNSFGR